MPPAGLGEKAQELQGKARLELGLAFISY